MKVLHVIVSLASRYGGPVTVLKDLVKAQKISGLDVTIYTTNMDYPKGFYCTPGERTLDATSDATVVFHKVDFSALAYSHSLAHRIKTQASSYDVIHIHGLYRFPPTYTAYQARKQGVPYIIMPHGSLDPYLYKRSTRGSVLLKRIYERVFDIPNLNHAGAIHYTAEEERKRASFLGLRAPSFVIPNGIDWGHFEKLPERGAVRTKLGIGGEPVVLFLGRLHFKKGLDLLIPAFDRVQQHYPGATLLIVGPDNDNYGVQVRSWVHARGLDSSVQFVGHLDKSDVIQAYVDADVFVLPSYTENFGMTVVEAMACELPVVISDQVNIHTEVAESGGGVVTHCDAKELADALLEVLGNADMRRTMGQAGRRLVKAYYTCPAIVDALTREYERAIARTRQGQRSGR